MTSTSESTTKPCSTILSGRHDALSFSSVSTSKARWGGHVRGRARHPCGFCDSRISQDAAINGDAGNVVSAQAADNRFIRGLPFHLSFSPT